MRTAGRRLEPGFTLLEVLVASVLIGTTFVAVVSIMSRSLRNIDRMQPHERACLHAREQMTDLLTREQLEPGRLRGSWDDDYRWQADITRVENSEFNASGDYALFDIRVQVYWGDPDRPRSYVLQTTQLAAQVKNADR